MAGIERQAAAGLLYAEFSRDSRFRLILNMSLEWEYQA